MRHSTAKKPSLSYLQPFGRKCYVHIPKEKRGTGNKLLPRAENGIFVGYTKVNHHYRIFIPERKHTYVSANVEFLPYTLEQPIMNSMTTSQEHNCSSLPDGSLEINIGPVPINELPARENSHRPAIQNNDNEFPSPDNFQQTLDSTSLQSSTDSTVSNPLSTLEPQSLPNLTNSHNSDENLIRYRRTQSGRQVRPRLYNDTITGDWWNVSNDISSHQPPVEFSTEFPDEEALINILEIPIPKSYNMAKQSVHWDQWEKAFNDEITSLRENNVWEVVPRPKGRKIVDGKWVCKVKGDAQGNLERFKARYVAKGFSQVQGLDYDETFAPVVQYDSLRLLLAISANKRWKPRQLDIKTAFLYGILNEEIYMQLPEGFRKEDHVARLNRCIYGLKQSPREWYFRLVEYLKPSGFTSSLFDPCVLVHDSGNLIMAIYVDDIILFGEKGDLIEQTVSLLKSEFKVNDMGILHWLLGIQIEYSESEISLSQTAYIDKILNRFSMQECNPVSSPIDPNHRLMTAEEGEPRTNVTTFQQIIGSIMYLVSGTRPDLAYTITHLSQFNSDPTQAHLNTAKRVLRYLKGTRNLKLHYKFDSPLVLNGFCDASYGNCLDTRRSFSGYIFQLGSSTISWRSRKQRTVAHSTCEAEYMAIALASKQYIWILRGLHRFLGDNIPAAISTDNTAAIELAHNPKLNDASKHIDIAYHFTRERIEDGSLTLLHVPSAKNLADICTKGLPRPRHSDLCTLVFGTGATTSVSTIQILGEK